jgi:hypothetical protein
VTGSRRFSLFRLKLVIIWKYLIAFVRILLISGPNTRSAASMPNLVCFISGLVELRADTTVTDESR